MFRHVLGRSAVGQAKVKALARELDLKLPYLEIAPVVMRADSAMEDGRLDLSSMDLVLVTIGETTTSRWLNARLHASRTPVVFTWLEPLGIGGHALATNIGDGPGCYECLFRTESGEENLDNGADFAAPGQRFARDLTGCAAQFTPYGSLDAHRTAEMAVRLAISALVDGTTDHVLKSWKGDAREFARQGFRLTERYGADERLLLQGTTTYARKTCPTCGR